MFYSALSTRYLINGQDGINQQVVRTFFVYYMKKGEHGAVKKSVKTFLAFFLKSTHFSFGFIFSQLHLAH